MRPASWIVVAGLFAGTAASAPPDADGDRGVRHIP